MIKLRGRRKLICLSIEFSTCIKNSKLIVYLVNYYFNIDTCRVGIIFLHIKITITIKVNMQRIFSFTKILLNTIPKPVNNIAANFSMFKNVSAEKLLPIQVPLLNTVCNFKVKGKVRRRCKSCYIVRRQERLYVICHEHPRHKQMAKKPKPLNTWILTHASQSKIRPW